MMSNFEDIWSGWCFDLLQNMGFTLQGGSTVDSWIVKHVEAGTATQLRTLVSTLFENTNRFLVTYTRALITFLQYSNTS